MKISREDLVNDVLKTYKENGNRLTREEYLAKGKYSRTPINRIFGGWNNMFRELNLEINMNRGITKEEIAKDIERLINEYGSVTAKIQRKYGKYSQAAIDNNYGSFTEMMKELGYKSKMEAREMSDEEILQLLENLYEEEGYLNSTLIGKKSGITPQTIYNRFGSMANVYMLLDINSEANKNCYFNSADYVIGVIADYLNENAIPNWVDDEIKNPLTNCKLRIDGYFPKHNLAVEYDGQQHFEYIPFLHNKDVNKFQWQQILDEWKNIHLISKNIAILRFKYDEPINIEYIHNKVDELLNRKSQE